MVRLFLATAFLVTSFASAGVSPTASVYRLPADTELTFNFTQSVLANSSYTKLQGDSDGDGVPNKVTHYCYLMHDSSKKDREVKKGLAVKVTGVDYNLPGLTVNAAIYITAVTSKGTAMNFGCGDGAGAEPKISMLSDFFTITLPAPEEISRVQE